MMRALLTIGLALAPAWLIAQTAAGPDFAVNTYTSNGQWWARVAAQAGGDFVVVWSSRWQDGDQYGIFARRFSPSGAPYGPEFQVNVHTTYTQGAPAIAATNDGGFVISWSSVLAYANGYEVRARRFDRAGAPLAGELEVNTYTTGSQQESAIAGTPDGGFVVSWASAGLDGSGAGIAARRFDAAGRPLGAEMVVNTHTAFNQRAPDVGVARDGTFVIVWEDYASHDGSGVGIFGQRFSAAGGQLGAEFQVNTYFTGNQQYPRIDFGPAGEFVVVWSGPTSNVQNISAQRFDPAGNRVGGEFWLNTLTEVARPSGIAHDGAGNFVVTWWAAGAGGTGPDVRARRMDSSGAGRGAEFLVSAYTTGIQRFGDVASDRAGNLLVTWSDDDRDGWIHGIFAQRFGGLRPVGLTLFDGGNNILEVPDNFGLVTAWQNISGAPQTFQGQGSEFTGPPGLVYTLGATTANYGTVPDGATVPCTGTCITGALLGTRPAGHVDVSVRERILPDALGQDQRWILHVGGSFTDVPPASGFYRFVETLLHRGVTGGCGAAAYCPAAATTREQMAVFALIAKEGPTYLPPACGATPMFADVPPASGFCRWIEELARRGVVGGCGGGNYCPSHAVTRDSMSIFVLRTLDPTLAPPACGAPVFADVPASNPFCRWIEELARRGIVSGCGGGNYCPAALVTREQMGVFIGVTFNLTLYGV